MSAYEFSSPVSLRGNFLREFLVDPMASLPFTGGAGRVIYNTQAGNTGLWWHDSAQWHRIWRMSVDNIVNQGVLRDNTGRIKYLINETAGFINISTGLSDPISTVHLWSIKLNQFASPDTNVSFNGQRLTDLAKPVNNNDAVRWTDLLEAQMGLLPLLPVKGIFTENRNQSQLGGNSVDNVTVSPGEAFLFIGQTNPAQNGVFLAGDPWVRRSDADTWDKLVRRSVAIENGTVYRGAIYVSTITAGGTLGTTPITWAQFNIPINISPGEGLSGVNVIRFGSLDEPFPQGSVPYFHNSSEVRYVPVGTANQFLVSNGTNAPAWKSFNGPLAYDGTNFTLVNGAVGIDKLANVAQGVLGQATASSGPVALIGVGVAHSVLRVESGGNISFGSINLAQSAAVTGTLGASRGGTGQNTYTIGDLLYASGATTLSRLTAQNGVLVCTGTGNAPSWEVLDLGGSFITGTLPANKGGLGNVSPNVGGLLVGGTGNWTQLNAGTNGHYLRVNSGAPAWQAPAALTRVNDTNVTITLGGSSSTALLNAASLTVGWTGTLAASRGGTGHSSYADGDLLVGNSSSGGILNKVTLGSQYRVLTAGVGGVSWSLVSLSNSVDGILGVSRGGTGANLSPLTTGRLIFASSTTAMGQTDGLHWDFATSSLGVGTTTPTDLVDVDGAVRVRQQLKLTRADGSVPMEVTSRTRVPNLNGDQLDGADVGNLALHGGVGFRDRSNQTNHIAAALTGQTIGSGDVSAWIRFRVPTSVSETVHVASLFADVNNFISLARITTASGGTLTISAVKAGSGTVNTALANFVTNFGGKVVDLVFTRIGTTITANLDGAEILSGTNASADVNIGAPTLILNGFTGSPTSARPYTDIYRAVVFNRALSAADVQSLIVNGVAPEDQWGTQTQLINASTLNGSFETAGSTNVFSSWSQTVNGSSTINRDTVVFNAGAASCRFDIDSANSSVNVFRNNELTAGKRYRISFDFRHNRTGTYRPQFNLGLSSDITSFGTPVSQNTWQRYTYEGVAETGIVRFTRPFSLGADSSQASAWYDDVIVERIGAVIDLELDRGFGITFPDRSSNNLTGQGSGDIVHLVPRKGTMDKFVHTIAATIASGTITHNLGTTDIIYTARWGSGADAGRTLLMPIKVENSNQVSFSISPQPESIILTLM
jgi:hypothetical protein